MLRFHINTVLACLDIHEGLECWLFKSDTDLVGMKLTTNIETKLFLTTKGAVSSQLIAETSLRFYAEMVGHLALDPLFLGDLLLIDPLLANLPM